MHLRQRNCTHEKTKRTELEVKSEDLADSSSRANTLQLYANFSHLLSRFHSCSRARSDANELTNVLRFKYANCTPIDKWNCWHLRVGRWQLPRKWNSSRQDELQYKYRMDPSATSGTRSVSSRICMLIGLSLNLVVKFSCWQIGSLKKLFLFVVRNFISPISNCAFYETFFLEHINWHRISFGINSGASWTKRKCRNLELINNSISFLTAQVSRIDSLRMLKVKLIHFTLN